MCIQYFKLLLTFITHSATIKYFRTLELIHFQIKIPKGGQAKAKEGRMLPPAPLKETLQYVFEKGDIMVNFVPFDHDKRNLSFRNSRK